MEGNRLFRETVKAVARGDGDKSKALNAEIADADRDSFNVYVTAMFAGLAGHVFEHDQSHDAIKRFVTEMRHDYRKADPPLKPLVLEGLLRALFGEEHFIDEISPADQLRTQLLTIRKITDQSAHVQEHLDDYLTDAHTLAQEWMSDD